MFVVRNEMEWESAKACRTRARAEWFSLLLFPFPSLPPLVDNIFRSPAFELWNPTSLSFIDTTTNPFPTCVEEEWWLMMLPPCLFLPFPSLPFPTLANHSRHARYASFNGSIHFDSTTTRRFEFCQSIGYLLFASNLFSGHLASACPKAGTPTCYNCNQEGHLSRDCPNERKAKACYKCGDEGHLSRDCPQNPAASYGGGGYGGAAAGGQVCYKCNQPGHISRNCPQQAAGGYGGGGYGGGYGGQQQGYGAPRACYTCGGVGHLSRDCTSVSKCFNCGGTDGHLSKDCPTPRAPRSCYQCGQEGHISRDCPGTPAESA